MDDVIARIELPRRRFTVEEYYRMGEAGILGPAERVELIEGEIVNKPVIGPRHAACVAELTRRFVLAAGERAVLWPQNPITISRDSVPEPDIALLRPRRDHYASDVVRPQDVLLVVEVADTSYRYDRDVKLRLYARAGITESWIVDLEHDGVEVFRQPGPSDYGSIERVARGGRVAPLAFPDIVVAVDSELLAR
jgi:hypothetical protein